MACLHACIQTYQNRIFCLSPQELKASGFTQQQLDASRAATAAQMQQLKAAAEEAKR